MEIYNIRKPVFWPFPISSKWFYDSIYLIVMFHKSGNIIISIVTIINEDILGMVRSKLAEFKNL